MRYIFPKLSCPAGVKVYEEDITHALNGVDPVNSLSLNFKGSLIVNSGLDPFFFSNNNIEKSIYEK